MGIGHRWNMGRGVLLCLTGNSLKQKGLRIRPVSMPRAGRACLAAAASIASRLTIALRGLAVLDPSSGALEADRTVRLCGAAPRAVSKTSAG
jgi:hypothetical protein